MLICEISFCAATILSVSPYRPGTYIHVPRGGGDLLGLYFGHHSARDQIFNDVLFVDSVKMSLDRNEMVS